MVAVLFARRDSIYKSFNDLDVFDFERNALNFTGGAPVIAHPPCRAWGELSHLAKPRQGEKELAFFAVDAVRKNGGVLEHPKKSKLWVEIGINAPGQKDAAGGWVLPISQHWFGHRAEKKTYLYIVGIEPGQLPIMPMVLGGSTHVITQPGRKANGIRLKKGDKGWRPEVTKAEREHTPKELAAWLVDVARTIEANRAI